MTNFGGVFGYFVFTIVKTMEAKNLSYQNANANVENAKGGGEIEPSTLSPCKMELIAVGIEPATSNSSKMKNIQGIEGKIPVGKGLFLYPTSCLAYSFNDNN